MIELEQHSIQSPILWKVERQLTEKIHRDMRKVHLFSKITRLFLSITLFLSLTGSVETWQTPKLLQSQFQNGRTTKTENIKTRLKELRRTVEELREEAEYQQQQIQ